MPRRLARQRMILSDLEWPFPRRALSLRKLRFLLVYVLGRPDQRCVSYTF